MEYSGETNTALWNSEFKEYSGDIREQAFLKTFAGFLHANPKYLLSHIRRVRIRILLGFRQMAATDRTQ